MESGKATAQRFLFILTLITFIVTLVYIQRLGTANSSVAQQLPSGSTWTHTIYQPGHRVWPNDTCPDDGDGMKLLILVTTAPAHVKQREAVRATWGRVTTRPDVGLAFVVGVSTNPDDNQVIETETQQHGDVIQGNFIDSYYNLTLKTISMLEWSRDHCSRVKYLLKTDDDMYIHMPVLFKLLDQWTQRKRSIMGKVAKKWKPVRNKKSKYYVSLGEYKPVLYPNFSTGPAYVVTSDLFQPLYEASVNGSLFKFEDVYVTGIIASKLDIKRLNCPEFSNIRIKLDPCAVNKLVSVHMVRPTEMNELYEKLQGNLTSCPVKSKSKH